jgi:PAS domain S-box-containing protein
MEEKDLAASRNYKNEEKFRKDMENHQTFDVPGGNAERDISLLNSILNNIGGAFILLDKDLTIILANKAFYKSFQLSEEETLNEQLDQLGNGRWNIPHLLAQLKIPDIENDPMRDFEITYDNDSSGSQTLCIDAKVINAGEEKFILLEIEDITEKVKADKDLRESIHRFNEFIYSSPSLIAILGGRDLIVQVANESMIETWGKGNEVIGKPLIREVLPEMAEQGMEDIFHDVYDTGIPFHAHEMPLYHSIDGKLELGYFDFIYQPQRNMKGEIDGVAVIATEVTEKAELHQKIKEDERKFRQLADLIPDKISTGTPDGNVTYYNQSWLDYTGLTAEDLLGRGWISLVHPDDIFKIEEYFKDQDENKSDFDKEIRLLNKDGEYRWHLSRAVHIRDNFGNLKFWVGASTEIHKFKEEEKRKEDFLKMVSHELKTPVTSIKGYIQLLMTMLDSGKNPDIGSLPLKSSLKRIDSQISRLTRLISEMLDLSRVEEARLELQKENFYINELVEESVKDLEYSFTSSRIKILKNERFKVFGDRDRLGQVLINFITNAIKYSPENKNIEVRIYHDREGMGSVSIKDRGIGIAKKDHKKIFERFYRVSGQMEDTYSGFGIGLFLAKEIIDRHNGLIRVNSKLGEGSQFIFSLPVSQ